MAPHAQPLHQSDRASPLSFEVHKLVLHPTTQYAIAFNTGWIMMLTMWPHPLETMVMRRLEVYSCGGSAGHWYVDVLYVAIAGPVLSPYLTASLEMSYANRVSSMPSSPTHHTTILNHHLLPILPIWQTLYAGAMLSFDLLMLSRSVMSSLLSCDRRSTQMHVEMVHVHLLTCQALYH